MFVELRDGEGFEQMLRRFTQQVNRQGVLKEHRRRRFFISKSEAERDRQKRNARRRAPRTPRSTSSSRPGGGPRRG
jgi:ribosomal protein S21